MKDIQVSLQPEALSLIEKYSQTNQNKVIGGVLLGEFQKVNDTFSLNISGVIKGEHRESFLKEFHYDHQVWREIYRVKSIEFPNLAILGWFHTNPGKPLVPGEEDYGIQRAFFQEAHQVLMLIDPLQNQSCLFHWQNQFLVPNADFMPNLEENEETDDHSVYQDPSHYHELSKEAEKLLQNSNQIYSNIGAMLDNRGSQAKDTTSGIGTGIALNSNLPIAGTQEINNSMSAGLKFIGILATCLTVILFLIYPVIRPVTTVTPEDDISQATPEKSVTVPVKQSKPNTTAPAKQLPKPTVVHSTLPKNPVANNPLPTNSQPGKRIYTIQVGDSLWDISSKYYGTGFDFYKIIKANKIINPNSLHVGTVLIIPE